MTEAQPKENILYLYRGNATFSKSEGGLLSLSLRDAGGKERSFARVVVSRAFPLTDPDRYLSVRESGTGKKEIGLILSLSELDEESEALVREELRARYFIPKIRRILSLSRRGLVYLKLETDIGRRTIAMRDDVSGFRRLENDRMILTDMEGCSYEIESTAALDKASYKRIEIFL